MERNRIKLTPKERDRAERALSALEKEGES
jgi:hypothetical protein